MKTPIKGTTMSTDWKVGLIPAIVCGVGIYILTRAYFNGGVYEILDDIESTGSYFGDSSD